MKCIECGYLAVYRTDQDPHDELNLFARDPATLPVAVHCYRNRWGRLEDAEKEATRDRLICRTAYPYSEGSPEEHRASHRARTTRRWVVAGASFGPFVAATTAVLTARPDVDLVSTAWVVGVAAVVLGVVVLAIDLFAIRD